MIYRTLGRTGLKVSQLGFGAMRLPMVGEGEAARVDRERAIPMIHRAFEGGLNYIDTAVMYCNYDSQATVGAALKGWRDRIVLSTKNHYFGTDEKAWWTNLENSLRLLDTDWIDIYNHHGIGLRTFKETILPVMSKWMIKAKEQGLIRHICTSFHDKNDALREIVDSGYVDVVTVQYNMLDRSLEDSIAHAHEKNVGVVVMGPVGGGRLGASSEVLESMVPGVKRVPELAMRFVLSNPNVTVALSGMSTIEQVEENLRIASDARSLSAEEQRVIDEQLVRLKQMADLYCTGCNYCKPCPKAVDIPAIFSTYNMARVYGFWDNAKKRYATITRKNASYEQCVQCGDCEGKCPQHIPIRKQLEQAHKALLG